MDSSVVPSLRPSLPRDLVASLVVFLVALPLCLGIALASGASPFSGILSGIVGGLVVGSLSGSHSSVSGPAAGLTAVVAVQIASLGSFDSFLLAVTLAGIIQLGLAWLRAGSLAAFFPTSVIKGLLAAIGVLLILKQIPHLLGHDADPVGDMAFDQPDHETTFSEFGSMVDDLHAGPAIVGLASLALLLIWNRVRWMKNSPVPAPLVVVVFGVIGTLLLKPYGGDWTIDDAHLVVVPVADGVGDFLGLLTTADFGSLLDGKVYTAALTIAIVASLETLLNLEAVDAFDPHRRHSPPNRELMAQGVGNITCGLIGGLPVTSVVVRSSVNLSAGATTRRSAIFHGAILLGCVAALPQILNLIPLSSLAAILLVTGLKLASPALFRDMWRKGRSQFLPFVVTVGAIVLTDLLVGIVIGIVVAVGFILRSNLRNPMRRFREKHVGGEVTRIELANQVTFLNRAALQGALDEIPPGAHCMLDAALTDYIDPDVLDMILEFQREVAPRRGVQLSLRGFKTRYDELRDRVFYVDYSSRETQEAMTPEQALDLLREGNERFLSGNRLQRDYATQVAQTAPDQFPMAAVLSCVDSRAPVELLFDMGLGDLFCVRMAGNVARSKVLGSLEYSCVVAGAKVILVMGHTSCGAVSAAVDLIHEPRLPSVATGCDNLDLLIGEIQRSVDPKVARTRGEWSEAERSSYIDEVALHNVERTLQVIRQESPAIDRMVREGKVGLVGAMYDVHTGRVEFLRDDAAVPA